MSILRCLDRKELQNNWHKLLYQGVRSQPRQRNRELSLKKRTRTMLMTMFSVNIQERGRGRAESDLQRSKPAKSAQKTRDSLLQQPRTPKHEQETCEEATSKGSRSRQIPNLHLQLRMTIKVQGSRGPPDHPTHENWLPPLFPLAVHENQAICPREVRAVANSGLSCRRPWEEGARP